jgi:Spy/CpxP family protein refolding chaperone
MKSFRFLVAALAVLLGTAIAKSQTSSDTPPPPPMHGHEFGMGPGPMGFFAKQLNLTDEQKTQMKAVMQKEHPAMKPLMEQQHQIDLQRGKSSGSSRTESTDSNATHGGRDARSQ